MSQLSSPLQALIELFQGPLAELRFADVDAAALAELAGGVESAASAVAEQEARLSELRQSLSDRQDALLVFAQRALAYARIYAEPDPALTVQLSRITLPKAAVPKASKPRKESAKAAAGSERAFVTDAEPLATQELAEAEAAASEEVGEPSSDAVVLDEKSADEPVVRAGKRRARAARDESQRLVE